MTNGGVECSSTVCDPLTSSSQLVACVVDALLPAYKSVSSRYVCALFCQRASRRTSGFLLMNGGKVRSVFSECFAMFMVYYTGLYETH